MVDFTTFEFNMETALLNGFSNSDDFADKIVDEYETAISGGTEPVGGNGVVTYNDGILRQAFKNMFQNSYDNNVVLDPIALHAALLTFWAGAIMETTGLPPGFSSVISNVVTASAIVTQFVPPEPQATVNPFVYALSDFLESHLTTVAGLISGLSSAPTPAPIVVPFLGFN